MRKSSAANSAASSPPVPARTSRIAFFSSASSFCRSSVWTFSSMVSNRLRTSSSLLAASLRVSGSGPSANSSSSACSTWERRRALMPSTMGESSLYSLASFANSPMRAGSAMAALNSAWRATMRSSLASKGVLPAISASEGREPILERDQRDVGLRAGVEIAHGGLVALQLILAENHGGARFDAIGAAHAFLQVAGISEIDREAIAAQLLRQLECQGLAIGRGGDGGSAIINPSRSIPAAQPTPAVSGPP